MAENPSADHLAQMQGTTPKLVELYDIFLTDGTHLRYVSDSEDGSYVDYVES
ncbi:MAG: hypothetical protein ACE5GM_03155 [bacterium]